MPAISLPWRMAGADDARPVGSDPCRHPRSEALLTEAHGADVVRQLCVACVESLPVDDASLSVMTDTDNRRTLHATDTVIAHISRQCSSPSVKGPCFEAFRTRRPVLVPDLATTATPAWPLFAAEMTGQPVGVIFAVPLQSGAHVVSVHVRSGAASSTLRTKRSVVRRATRQPLNRTRREQRRGAMEFHLRANSRRFLAGHSGVMFSQCVRMDRLPSPARPTD